MIILVVLLYAVLASTFTVAKITLGYAKPLFLVGTRMILSGFILLAYYAYKNRSHKNLITQTQRLFCSSWNLFAQVTLFHVYLTYVLDFWSLQYMSSAKSAFIYSFSPFAAALLSYFLYGQCLSYRQKISMGLGFCSIVPILFTTDIGIDFLRIGVPELALFVAMFSATYAWFVVKQLMERGFSLVFINGITMVLGGTASLITFWLCEGTLQPGITSWGAFLSWTFLLIGLSNLVFYNLYGYLLQYYSLTFLSFAGFLTPLFSALFGRIFLGEELTVSYFFSFLGIVVSLTLFYTDSKPKRSKPC